MAISSCSAHWKGFQLAEALRLQVNLVLSELAVRCAPDLHFGPGWRTCLCTRSDSSKLCHPGLHLSPKLFLNTEHAEPLGPVVGCYYHRYRRAAGECFCNYKGLPSGHEAPVAEWSALHTVTQLASS